MKYTSHRKLQLGKFDKHYRRATHDSKYNASQLSYFNYMCAKLLHIAYLS